MPVRSKTSLECTVAAILLCLPSAAPAAAQQVDWTRVYLGGQAGYSRDRLDITSSPPGPGDAIQGINGFIGGIHGGGNFVQQGGFVFGLVGDFNWLSAFSNASVTTQVISYNCEECVHVTDNTSDFKLEIEWKASVRGKAGFLVAPGTLVYTTAGVAFARIDLALSESLSGLYEQETVNLTGLVFGAGVETLLTSNVTAFAQVLHYTFGSETVQLINSQVNVDLEETIFQLGLSLYLN